MLAAVHSRFGDPAQVLTLREQPDPPLRPGQVRLEMLAAPINPSDLLMIAGRYGIRPALPATAGNEGIGRVLEIGPGVVTVAPGQRVLAPLGGTWRQRLVAAAVALTPLPQTGDPLQLAMLSINPATASLLLSSLVTLAPGDWIAQTAANAAVGGYLIQIAKHRGLKTANIVRRAAAAETVRALGGDVVLLDGPAFAERITAAIGGAPLRLALDPVGGPLSERLADALSPGGTLVGYGALSALPFGISPRALIFKSVTVRGFWLSTWLQTANAAEKRQLYGDLARLTADGTLQARIGAVFPLERLQDAIAHASAGGGAGKTLLALNGLERIGLP